MHKHQPSNMKALALVEECVAEYLLCAFE
uniref:Uncharacterized protein n=1 Tax=Anguilla anguilla TaxID=7936 RepID=A0A0E9RTB1_ANGAN